jgi:trigger factor
MKMLPVNIQEEKIDALNAQLKVEVKLDDYMPKVEDAIKRYRKSVSMKGFRKGMVPPGLVKKMYGPQIMAESINEILSDSVNNYLKENELDILGYPIPKEDQDLNFDIHSAGDFDFIYELGLSPKFEIGSLSNKTKFEKDVVDVDDKMVDEEIENLRKRYGQPGQAEEVQDDDILKIRLEQLGEDGQPLEEGISNETTVNLRMIKDKVQKEVKKLKKGESLTNEITKIFEREPAEIAKHLLDTDEETMNAGPKDYRMTIVEITRIQQAEMNEAFFQNVLGKEDIKDEKAFREGIREEISKYYDQQADQRLINEIAEQFIEKTEIPLPEEFLKKWIKVSNEKEITVEELEKDFPNFTKNLRWSLIVNKIAKDNDIKVEQEELIERTRGVVMNQLYQYGLYNAEPEQVEQLVGRYMQDRDHLSKMRDSLMEEKVFDVIKDQVTIKDKKVSLDQFNKQS